MPRFFTKRNNGTYVNIATGEVQQKTPKEGWRIKRNNKTGKNFYINMSSKTKPTFTRPKNNVPVTNHPGLYSPKHMEEFQRSSPKAEAAVAPVKMLTSANLAGKLEAAERAREAAERAKEAAERELAEKLEAERAREAERAKEAAEREQLKRELAELKRQMASAVPPVATVSNNPATAKFKKMLSMGIPRTAVDQKMRMEGLDPSMLNGVAPTSVVNAPSASFRPPGNPMAGLMSGILGGPSMLRKTNGPQKMVVENAPINPKKNFAKAMAKEAAAVLKKMVATGNTRSIEQKIANARIAKTAPPVSLRPSSMAETAATMARRGSNTNHRLNTQDPSSPKTRKNRRANRKSRKNRRSNFSA